MTTLQAMSRDAVVRPIGNDLESLSNENQGAVRSSPRDIQETLYLLKLGVITNLRWLERGEPNVDAAVQTSNRIYTYIEKLEILLREGESQ